MLARENNSVHTNGWGVDLQYEDAGGNWHQASPQTIEALLRAMKADVASPAPPETAAVLVIRQGEQHQITSSGSIELEGGGSINTRGRLPSDLPIGYHVLLLEGQKPRRLIVGPAHCWLPEQLKTWGWAVQLYAARSRESWGMGDLADLEKLAAWSAKMGAGMLLVNPLSAAIPLPHQQPSPYYPSSRRFLNLLWLHIEWIPGAGSVPALKALAATARTLNQQRAVNRNRVFELKMQALNALWLCAEVDDAFQTFCQAHGQDLETYATYCALAEHYQAGWHSWPAEYRHPGSSAVVEFARAHRSRVDFHKWVQWELDRQMIRCGKHLALMQDLPIGVDPDGADCWAWQDLMTLDAAIGAPPDEFNTQGQNWGLPPFIPHKLREAAYEPFIQTVRAAIRNTGGLRVDHVMGLFRLFCIPSNMKGGEGAYVRYDYEDLLTILALESVRAHAYVVGEDLGTVEDQVRRHLAAHRVLSYRLVWFEEVEPAGYPVEALAAVTTHDLPTVAGLWSGADLARQEELQLKPNQESTRHIRHRLAAMAHIGEQDSIAQVIEKTYQLLARAPARILTAALDDAAQVKERPNMPATTVETNWSVALPMPIEELMAAELPRKIALALRRET